MKNVCVYLVLFLYVSKAKQHREDKDGAQEFFFQVVKLNRPFNGD